MMSLKLEIRLVIIGTLVAVFGSSCAKFTEYEAVFPPENDQLTRFEKIVVVNDNRGDLIQDLFENALKTQLTSISPGNIDATKSGDEIAQDIKSFRYDPKVDTMSPKKVAYLSYQLNSTTEITRGKKSRSVSLERCNYLAENRPCYYASTATLSKGNQVVKVSFKGSVTLRDGNGKTIMPPYQINRFETDSNQFVMSPLELVTKGLNRIAAGFAQKIIPHKERIKSEILRGGDSISVSMIQNKAYEMAVNRLSKLIVESETPVLDDLYNLGIAFEALNEMHAAADFLNKAKKLDPEHNLVAIALNRVQRFVPSY